MFNATSKKTSKTIRKPQCRRRIFAAWFAVGGRQAEGSGFHRYCNFQDSA